MKYYYAVFSFLLLFSVRGLSQSGLSANAEIKIRLIKSELMDIEKLFHSTENFKSDSKQHHLGKRNILINTNVNVIHANIIKNRKESNLFVQSAKKIIKSEDYCNISYHQILENPIITIAF